MAQLPPPEARSLPQPPTDGITGLSYFPWSPSNKSNSSSSNNSLLVSTSWDGTVRIHDTKSMKPVSSHAMDSGPLLSLTVIPKMHDNDTSGTIITGGMDGTVRKFDVASSTSTVVGKHTPKNKSDSNKVTCSCLVALEGPFLGLFGSASWDGMFYVWDSGATSMDTPAAPIAKVELPGKAFAMDYDPVHHRIVVATSGRRMVFLDLQENDGGDVSVEIVLERESSLKYQTRTVRFLQDGSGLTVGSIEGRVAVEFLDDLSISSGKKKYAFKCHRDGDVVYPVNTIAIHPGFGTFATGGCDGTVVTWDGLNKKKLVTLPKFPTSISALAFNHDGSELAIASSYTFEEGERDHPRDEIFIRDMLESECKPKQTTN